MTATQISLVIEGLVFMIALIGAVGGVWAKLTRTINDQDKRLVKAETELHHIHERDQKDGERWGKAFERFEALETEIGEIDKKVVRIEAKYAPSDWFVPRAF